MPASLKEQTKAAADDWRKTGKLRDLWAGDAAVWTGGDEAKWLGWLHVVEERTEDLPALTAFADEVKAAGSPTCCCWAWAASSLGPEVLAETFGRQPGFPTLLVLDSTDPQQVAAFAARWISPSTLCIVSSKSGSTLEPNILKAYFFDRMKQAVGDKAGSHFVAVTDPGSKMQKVAEADGFRHVFMGDPAIGGRYSVLSNFGMVPAAAMGLDLQAFLRTTALMVRSCAAGTPPGSNPGVQLGLHPGHGGEGRARQGHGARRAGAGRCRRLAGAAAGGKHGQAGARHRARGRRAAGRTRGVRRGPGVRPPDARAARRATRPGSRRWRLRASPSCASC